MLGSIDIVGVSLPEHETIISNSNGTITYMPQKLWAGVDVLGYSVTDGHGGIATAQVAVTVKQKAQNHISTVTDQSVSLKESILKITLQARDLDHDPLKLLIVSKPSHGKLSELSAAAGTLIYTPDLNFAGRDSFKFKVNDGLADSKDAKLTVKVQATKDSHKNQILKQNPIQQHKKQQPIPRQNNNNDNSTQQHQQPEPQPTTS